MNLGTAIPLAKKMIGGNIKTAHQTTGLDSSGWHDEYEGGKNPDVLYTKKMCYGGAESSVKMRNEKGEDFHNLCLAIMQAHEHEEEFTAVEAKRFFDYA